MSVVVPVCDEFFRIIDYPPGYLIYKYQVRPGTGGNTCPACEAGILRRTIQAFMERKDGPLTAKSIRKREDYIVEMQQDVCLLLTGRLMCDRQRKNAQKVYGELAAPLMRRQRMLGPVS